MLHDRRPALKVSIQTEHTSETTTGYVVEELEKLLKSVEN